MRTRCTLTFSCMVQQEDPFSFLLLSVADIRGRQLSFPLSVLPAVHWLEERQVALFTTSSPDPAQEHRHKAVTFSTTAFVTTQLNLKYCFVDAHCTANTAPCAASHLLVLTHVFNFFLHMFQGHLVPWERPWDTDCNQLHCLQDSCIVRFSHRQLEMLINISIYHCLQSLSYYCLFFLTHI